MTNIQEQIILGKKELEDLYKYPSKMLVDIIKEVGFSCECCAKCCSNEFNDHVFVLNVEVIRIKSIIPEVLIPAPYFEFCDNNGVFYVSGYSLATRNDGTCVFLENKRCKIYVDRPMICRLYPYMLHREPDENGKIEWRQISGLNEHGCYNCEITDEESKEFADLTKEYETLYLQQQIGFLQAIDIHFKNHNLKHVQSIYDKKMRLYHKGEKITVMVYFNNRFKKHIC